MKNLTSPKAKSHGFTLVELMVTVAIAAILLTVGVPSMRNMIESQRARSISGELHSALTLARSEAIKRNANVTLSPQNSAWINGWQITAGSLVIEQQPAIANVTITGPSSIIFQSSGRISTGSDTSFTITAGSYSRCVYVGLSGRPSVKSC